MEDARPREFAQEVIKPVATARQSIESLQVLRGFAAVSVAFYHVYIIMMEPQYGGNVIFQSVAKYGFLGVSFFFVLSGFIIFMAHSQDIGKPGTILRYAYKRIARVYPAYWVYLSGFILAAAVGFGHPDFSWNPWNLASSYLLVPLIDDVTLPLKVAWTLVYEMRFYAIFIVLLIFGWTALWAFAAWGVAILFLFLSGIGGPDVLSLWNLYFLAGMVGYLVLDRIPPRYGLAILAGGVVLFVIYALLAHDVFRIRDLSQSRPELHLVLAPAFLALILGAVLIERNYDMRYPNFLMLLGDASYSIYLVHSAAISACILISAKLGLIEMMGHYLFFAFAFLFSVFVGVAAYLLVEKPLIGLSRRIWK